MDPYWLFKSNDPPSNGLNSNGGILPLIGAFTKERYLNWLSSFSNAQCCISSLTGFASFLLTNDIAYTALIRSEPLGNMNLPPTKALTATSQVSLESKQFLLKSILIPHLAQLKDCTWLPLIK